MRGNARDSAARVASSRPRELSDSFADSSFTVPRYGQRMLADFTLTDQEARPWRLSDHLDAAAMLVFLRGDW